MVLMPKTLSVKMASVWSYWLALRARVMAASSARFMVCLSGCDFISICVVVWVLGLTMDVPRVGLSICSYLSIYLGCIYLQLYLYTIFYLFLFPFGSSSSSPSLRVSISLSLSIYISIYLFTYIYLSIYLYLFFNLYLSPNFTIALAMLLRPAPSRLGS